MDSCPPLEEIAAFLDGTLTPEDRERITAHLASCESCYEVFAGAVHFQEDDDSAAATKGGVIPFPFAGETDRTGVSLPPTVAPEKVRPRARRWLALAASVLLVPALGFFAWRAVSTPTMALAGLVEQVEGSPGIDEHLYLGETYRSNEAPEYLLPDRPTFLTGVHLLDLRLSLDAGADVDTTDRLLQNLGLALQEVPGMSAVGELYLKSREGQLDRNALSREEEKVQQELSELLDFQFGLWTEAGRLAASTESPEFFGDRNNRRFLSHLFKQTPWVGDDLLEDVPGELQAIQQTWEGGDLTDEDYTALADHFENIIAAYDSSDEP